MDSPPPRPAPSAALILGLYAVSASLVTIFQRYLSFHFDQFTQNFYRFLTGAACLLLLSSLLWPRELLRLLRSRRGMAGVGAIAAGGIVAQALYVEGVGRTSAAIAGLISILMVPLTTALGAAIFADERHRVQGRGFLVGAPLALLGAVGLALSHRGSAETGQSGGIYYLLIATVMGSGLTAMSKRMVLSFHPVCTTTLTTSLMCPFFLLGALLWGDVSKVGQAPPVTVAILLGSGAYGLLIGGAFFYLCLQKYGMVLTTFTNLAAPVFTGVLGYLVFAERLSTLEIGCGAALLVGCYLVVAGRNNHPGATSAPAE